MISSHGAVVVVPLLTRMEAGKKPFPVQAIFSYAISKQETSSKRHKEYRKTDK